MAAVDYARLRQTLSRGRLLFIAHRKEILDQSRATFQYALRDASFGELWVDGARPERYEHVFASVQSLSRMDLSLLDPKHFDVVIIDEFHHAAAASYDKLLKHLHPVELLGLTATPERADGTSVLHWFGDRIAAERAQRCSRSALRRYKRPQPGSKFREQLQSCSQDSRYPAQ